MNKIFNFFLFIIITLFIYNLINYYSSNQNIKNINLNRLNVEKNLKNKMLDLTVLADDTANVIEFNTSFPDETNKNQQRKFWKLLKFK